MPLGHDAALAWLARWDRQQERYLPEREERFRTMLDLVEAAVPTPAFDALDLACGPGSVSQRLLDRFPEARVTAIDFDPVLLAIGRAARAGPEPRLRWVEGDLRTPEWDRALGEDRFDVVLTTTALHWLDPPTLARLYADLARRLRPRGLFLNGDEIRTTEPAGLTPLTERVREQARERRHRDGAVEDWDVWWSRVAAEPGLSSELALRRERFPKEHKDEQKTSLEAHQAALRAAGFGEVGVLYQRFDDRILVALR